MKLIYVMLPALCVLSGTIGAAETPLAEAPVEVFEGQSSVEKPPAPFPMSERKRGGEGWVIVHDDRPRRSPRGDRRQLQRNPAFEKSALDTVENKWRFNPATLNGTP